MKLMNIKDVDDFFDLINKCEGDVELLSDDGDRINLKSTLCQFIAKEVFSGMINELELVVHNPSDVIKIMNFMINNN